MYRFPSYLGHAPHGWSRSLRGTPELTAEDSDLVLRVRSMLAAHASLYVTRAGGDAVKASIRKSLSGKRRNATTSARATCNGCGTVKATFKPPFCQSCELQGANKRDLPKDQENFSLFQGRWATAWPLATDC
jgi:hypothetical protein